MELKNRIILVLLGITTALSGVAYGLDYSLDQNFPQSIVINNRILLKIDGKPISVMDVVRKMDLLFYRQFADLASSTMARYQFYMGGWRAMLGAVIDDYLIMADAKEKKIEVNDGEVREELENLFGPDVVLNLDKLGLTLEEAFELLKTELTVQRMTGIMVRSKAMTEVRPKGMRKRYEKILEENPPQTYWVYKILSIRGDEHERVANEAHRLISEQNVPFEEVVKLIDEEGIELAISEEYRQNDSHLSLAYRAVLESLSAGVSSAPISNKKGSRIFCLKEIDHEKQVSFSKMEEELKKEITQEAIAHHNQEYREKLRKHYGLTEKYLNHLVPEDLQPFSLR